MSHLFEQQCISSILDTRCEIENLGKYAKIKKLLSKKVELGYELNSINILNTMLVAVDYVLVQLHCA